MFPPYQRVAVLVDVQNMFYSAKHQYRAKLDFAKLLHACVDGRQLVRAIAYTVQSPDVDQSHFLNLLRQTGYEVKAKQLRLRPDGTAKGDWDMGMAMDAIAMAERVDTLVLVTGDGDFVDLANMLKARGLRVEVVSFPTSTAEVLKEAATEYVGLGPDMLLAGSQMSSGRTAAPVLAGGMGGDRLNAEMERVPVGLPE